MRLFPRITWKLAAGLALVGGLLGAAYARHRDRAAERIQVAIKPVDHLRSSLTPFERCAKLVGPENCGYDSHPRRIPIQWEFVKDAAGKDKALLIEFEQGNPESLTIAQRWMSNRSEVERFVAGRTQKQPAMPPILSGIGLGLFGAVLIDLVRHSISREPIPEQTS